MIPILGQHIFDGEFSGRAMVLHLSDRKGKSLGVTIRMPPAWEYCSCLGALSSDLLEDRPTDGNPELESLLIGLVGAEITLFQIRPASVVLECNSIRLEKRFRGREDFVEIVEHGRSAPWRIGPEHPPGAG